MKKNRLRYLIISLVALFVAAFIFIYFFSNKIFENTFEKYISRFNNRINGELIVGYKNYTFPNDVDIAHIALVNSLKDTILKIDSVSFNVNLWSVLKRDPAPSDLFAKNIYLNLIHTDSLRNYLLLKEQQVVRDTTGKSDSGFNNLINRLFNVAFDKIPPELDVEDIMLYFTGNYGKMIISVPSATIKDKSFSSNAVLSDENHLVHWEINGNINSRKETIFANIKQVEPGMNSFTGVLANIEMLTGFDSLQFELNNINRSKNRTSFHFTGTGTNMKLFHQRLAKDTVSVQTAGFDFNLNIGKNEFIIEENSVINLNEIPAQIHVNYNHEKPQSIFLKYETDNVASQSFFNSLPAGMFTKLNGIETSGELQMSMQFGYDFALPDSALFEIKMKTSDFSIKKMGEADLRMMNNSFVHNVYEKDRLIRSFVVGPGNQDFVELEYISPFLRNSILTSEDGGFYSHRGFNEEAFRKSIVENIKKRRFARGGSTITMQLVKNVYLRRDKVISRKAEEALIVWLIENQRLVSKHRMFEVYLNIIEWGPGIYGISEASRFYFAKHPSTLTLAESIYLASIVPRPKLFRYSFDQSGNLRGYLEGYYRLLAGIMLRRGQISQIEYDSLTPHIVLQGPARELVLPPDSLQTDPWLEFEGDDENE